MAAEVASEEENRSDTDESEPGVASGGPEPPKKDDDDEKDESANSQGLESDPIMAVQTDSIHGISDAARKK